jgi:hypothetical protein
MDLDGTTYFQSVAGVVSRTREEWHRPTVEPPYPWEFENKAKKNAAISDCRGTVVRASLSISFLSSHNALGKFSSLGILGDRSSFLRHWGRGFFATDHRTYENTREQKNRNSNHRNTSLHYSGLSKA